MLDDDFGLFDPTIPRLASLASSAAGSGIFNVLLVLEWINKLPEERRTEYEW